MEQAQGGQDRIAYSIDGAARPSPSAGAPSRISSTPEKSGSSATAAGSSSPRRSLDEFLDGAEFAAQDDVSDWLRRSGRGGDE